MMAPASVLRHDLNVGFRSIDPLPFSGKLPINCIGGFSAAPQLAAWPRALPIQ